MLQSNRGEEIKIFWEEYCKKKKKRTLAEKKASKKEKTKTNFWKEILQRTQIFLQENLTEESRERNENFLGRILQERDETNIRWK